jgi:alanine racemase
MIDTGMHRLGLAPAEAAAALAVIYIAVLHSHLACAEQPGHPLNAVQLSRFADLAAAIPARRRALANSGGITLGSEYCFDLTRPGIGLYGGGAGPGDAALAPVASISAPVMQVRAIEAGDSVGYGATFAAPRPLRIAVVALGYADGYPRSLSNAGSALVGDAVCPGVGRISMDLAAFDVTAADPRLLAEDGWIDVNFNLAATAAASGRTEYELLTGLGARYARDYR